MDLLPGDPNSALSAIEGYIAAHAYVLPDGRWEALADAAALIRAKYIGLAADEAQCMALLHDMSSRDFERLIAVLYQKMGYDVIMTPATGDGGRDLDARRTEPGQTEYLLVECSLWQQNVQRPVVDRLVGVMTNTNATKGVVVTTSGFSVGAVATATRHPIELIDGSKLISLLNLHVGPSWPVKVDSLRSNRKPEKRRRLLPLSLFQSGLCWLVDVSRR